MINHGITDQRATPNSDCEIGIAPAQEKKEIQYHQNNTIVYIWGILRRLYVYRTCNTRIAVTIWRLQSCFVFCFFLYSAVSMLLFYALCKWILHSCFEGLAHCSFCSSAHLCLSVVLLKLVESCITHGKSPIELRYEDLSCNSYNFQKHALRQAALPVELSGCSFL